MNRQMKAVSRHDNCSVCVLMCVVIQKSVHRKITTTYDYMCFIHDGYETVPILQDKKLLPPPRPVGTGTRIVSV